MVGRGDPVTVVDPDDAALDDLAAELLLLDEDALRAFLTTCRPGDQHLIERALARQQAVGWRADPVTFMAHFNPSWTIYPYQRLLGRKFRELVTGEDPYQVWNLPARYGKSTIASQYGPAWALDRSGGTARSILTSYGDTLALENADIVRTILESHADELTVRLRPDRRARGRFATPQRGGILAAGINSSITGFGAGAGGGVVIDDPFKNWQDAHSEAARELVWNQFRSVLRLRLDPPDRPGAPPAWMLIVHTRWHEDDLTGRVVKHAEATTGMRFTIVRLPAIAEAADPKAIDPVLRLPDPLGRAPGETLGRFPDGEVEQRAIDLGSYLAAGLEQQRPAPAEGGELKRAWWRLIPALPARFDGWASSWDMKLKERETGDYTVGQVWGRIGGDYFLVAQWRGRWDQPTAAAAIALASVRYPGCRRHFVETGGYGPEVVRTLRKGRGTKYQLSDEICSALGIVDDERAAVQAVLRRGLSGLIGVPPKHSKVVRARAVSPLLEAGNVHVVESDPQALALIEEAAQFPNGTHDDMVDAWSQAMSRMARGSASTSRPGAATAAPPAESPAETPGRAQSQSVSRPTGRVRKGSTRTSTVRRSGPRRR